MGLQHHVTEPTVGSYPDPKLHKFDNDLAEASTFDRLREGFNFESEMNRPQNVQIHNPNRAVCFQP